MPSKDNPASLANSSFHPRTAQLRQAVSMLLVLTLVVGAIALVESETLLSAFPSLRTDGSGVAWGAFGALILLGILHRFTSLALERGTTIRTAVFCPGCAYPSGCEWSASDFVARPTRICSECGVHYSLVEHHVSRMCPSGLWLEWRQRVGIALAAGAGLGTFGAAAAISLQKSHGGNELLDRVGFATAGAAAGLLGATLIYECVTRVAVRTRMRSNRCQRGHPGVEGYVTPSRILFWCGQCANGWWAPTTREDYLAAVAAELERERQANEVESPK